MINNLIVFAVTLARGGSKKIPKKNIVPLCGKPLLEYTIDEVKKSKYIDKYIISTDDKDIMSVCRNNNVTYFERSQAMASDTAKSSDAIIEVISVLSNCDIIVEVMCTNPLKTVEDIDGCIEQLIAQKADSCVSVVQIYDHHPSRVKYIEDGILKDFYPEIAESRRQDLTPPAYVRNGSIYVTYRNLLYTTKRRLSGKIVPYIMSEERTINIDEPLDLLVAEKILELKNA